MKRCPSVLRAAAICGVLAQPALADEGGVSFWLSGQQGSLAAVPGAPGWSLPVVYYHTSGDMGGEATRRAGRIAVGVEDKGDLFFLFPTYTFATPVAGGRASLALGGGFGRLEVDVAATLSGPRGNAISGAESDSLTSIADLYPTATLKWNQGVHNYMVYAMGGVPVGSYSVGRLANLGTNHWSIDGGAGYTYFNPKSGHEFSAVAGLTYNFENKDTDYQNGVSAHLDWAASQFISPHTHIGLVGYFYNQLSGDSGSGAVLGDHKSRVAAIGPQLGHFFEVGKEKWYVNLKGYYEFNAKNRAEGWNVWLALAIPLGGAPK